MPIQPRAPSARLNEADQSEPKSESGGQPSAACDSAMKARTSARSASVPGGIVGGGKSKPGHGARCAATRGDMRPAANGACETNSCDFNWQFSRDKPRYSETKRDKPRQSEIRRRGRNPPSIGSETGARRTGVMRPCMERSFISMAAARRFLPWFLPCMTGSCRAQLRPVHRTMVRCVARANSAAAAGLRTRAISRRTPRGSGRAWPATPRPPESRG